MQNNSIVARKLVLVLERNMTSAENCRLVLEPDSGLLVQVKLQDKPLAPSGHKQALKTDLPTTIPMHESLWLFVGHKQVLGLPVSVARNLQGRCTILASSRKTVPELWCLDLRKPVVHKRSAVRKFGTDCNSERWA